MDPAPTEPARDICAQQLTKLVERTQKLMSHAWMIRTFVKHSDEVEDFPQLNEMARTIFDVFRAVETQMTQRRIGDLGLENHREIRMVGQVLPDARQIMHDIDTDRPQMVRRPDP